MNAGGALLSLLLPMQMASLLEPSEVDALQVQLDESERDRRGPMGLQLEGAGSHGSHLAESLSGLQLVWHRRLLERVEYLSHRHLTHVRSMLTQMHQQQGAQGAALKRRLESALQHKYKSLRTAAGDASGATDSGTTADASAQRKPLIQLKMQFQFPKPTAE